MHSFWKCLLYFVVLTSLACILCARHLALGCRVLNNLAMLDLLCLQRLLGGADLRLEIFHVISFLLMYCFKQFTAEPKVSLL